MRPRTLALAVASIAIFLAGSLFASDTNQITQRVRELHQQKTYILRGFYGGSTLHYGATGFLLDQTIPGDWTVDGVVEVEDARISGDRLIIYATRLHMGWIGNSELHDVHDLNAKGEPDQNEKLNRSLEIDADLGAALITTESAEVAFSRIFLTSNDSFVEFVPDYWKRCIRSALDIVHIGAVTLPASSNNGCRFSSEFLNVPGVTSLKDSGKEQSLDGSVFHVMAGMTPPRVKFGPEPEFSSESRKAKFQGTEVLNLVVSKDGLPINIQIIRPLGCGLDQKAIDAVRSWKFEPAQRDGRPVAVEIAVEVDFHLY